MILNEKQLKHKEEILKLKEGGIYIVPESDYGLAEIRLINELYFLFEIPMYGGTPDFSEAYPKYRVDEMISTYSRWA